MPSISSYAVDPLGQRAGFTLVELLVSCVVCALMVAFLFKFFNATNGAWHSGTNRLDTFANARAALQMMERDISETTAVIPVNVYPAPSPYPGTYSAPTPTPTATPTPTPTVNPLPMLVIDRYPAPTPAFQSGDEINQELYCLTDVPNSGTSNLCAVGYFCAWMPDLIPATDPLATQKKASAPASLRAHPPVSRQRQFHHAWFVRPSAGRPQNPEQFAARVHGCLPARGAIVISLSNPHRFAARGYGHRSMCIRLGPAILHAENAAILIHLANPFPHAGVPGGTLHILPPPNCPLTSKYASRP